MSNQCELSNEQLLRLSQYLCRILDGRHDWQHENAALAIRELIDFREGVNGPLRVMERSMAYEHACDDITSFCMTWEDPVTGEEWHDTGEVDEFGAQDVKDAVLYLDLKGLLYRHPLELNCVQFHNESEATQ